jgi:hypothetical protein
MKLTPKQRLALIVFCQYKCEICVKLGKDITYFPEELEIHRIKAGYENGDYTNHRTLAVLCKKHHQQISQGQRMNLGIQN